MNYVVLVTWTTGKVIEEYTFSDLAAARKHFEYVVRDTTHKRVLIVLAERFTYDFYSHEEIIDVHFVEGISYLVPSVTVSKRENRHQSK